MPKLQPEPRSGSSNIQSPVRQRSGNANSSTSSASSGGGGKKEVKKLSSLSSFQATLNFKVLPVPNKHAESSTRKPSPTTEDAHPMPPPPSDFRPKPRNQASLPTKGDKGKARAEIIVVDDDEDVPRASRHDMWADQFAPCTIADLATGKARITSVKEWLHLALYGHPSDARPEGPNREKELDRVRKYKRILLVTGPAGIGKTTSVRVIAQEMGVDLMEWGEGVEESSIGSTGYDRESPLNKLSTFLSRNEYAPLSMSNTPTRNAVRPRAILLSSLPNVSHLPTREAFHLILARFCQSYSSSSCPLIIVQSDTGSRGSAEESWRDRDRGGREGALSVLGKDVSQGPWCTQVEFIPLAPTFMIKALRRVLELASKTVDFEPPTAAALQLVCLTSSGDLRSAINSIQMLCTHTAVQAAKGRKRKNNTKEAGGRKTAVVGKDARGWVKSKLDIPDDIRAVLDALTRKEQNINLFHALGKVFYNKRLGDPSQDEEDKELVAYVKSLPTIDRLPYHLTSFDRRRALIQIDDFIGSIPVDASSFALWLEQSAPNYCEDIDQAHAVAEELGAADIMRTDDDIWQSSQQAISYALHLSIRGVMMGLPSPVPRNRQKIHKPQFFQAYKDQRTNTGLVDVAAAYLTKKAITSSCVLSDMPLNAEGVGAWGGMSTQTTLATEILPMMIKMQRIADRPLLPASVAPLRLPPYGVLISNHEELTSTQRVGDDFEAQIDVADEEEAYDHAGHGWDMEEEQEEVEEKGWLEEDDIEDWD